MQSIGYLIKFAVENGVAVLETVQQVVTEVAALLDLVLLLLHAVEQILGFFLAGEVGLREARQLICSSVDLSLKQCLRVTPGFTE
jgi:hypothetical protein